MTTDTKRELIAVLAGVWSLSPDVRLGQLMAHLGFLGEGHLGRALGDIEDDDLVAILYRHRAELLARIEGTAVQPAPPGSPGISVSGSPTFVDQSPPT